MVSSLVEEEGGGIDFQIFFFFEKLVTYQISEQRARLRTYSPEVYEMISVPPLLTAGTPHTAPEGCGSAIPTAALVVQAVAAGDVLVVFDDVTVPVARGVQLKQLAS